MIRPLLLSFLCGWGLLAAASPAVSQTRPLEERKIPISGHIFVHLVDPARWQGTTPHIVWTSDARLVEDLPEACRTHLFNSVNDVKPVEGGARSPLRLKSIARSQNRPKIALASEFSSRQSWQRLLRITGP